jgi:uncharacterized protein YecE (DUF72 family)
MDFGKLDDVSNIDFTLPPDNPLTHAVLEANKKSEKPQIFIGPPIWANRDWVGKIYPSNTKDKDYLYHFSRQFNTIELNVTHYQIPTLSMIEKWIESTPENFKFCPKFPQPISHDRMLIGCESMTYEFCNAILGLENRLGTTFLQLAPSFEPKHLKSLENYLKIIPKELPLTVEFRNQNWFQNQSAWESVSQLLIDAKVGTVITDVSGRRDVLHQTLTTPQFTLRFVGNELHPTDYQRIDDWIDRLEDWVQRGLQRAYIFVHSGDNRYAPELTKYWIQQLNSRINLSIQEPQIRPEVVQGSLF